ncbi:1-pyrroline-5-carboxylate dehydrogenase [Clostridium sulfidigenes]|uniref:1-pyrroline-5-carboxylate dehydrogenase n=1 Tax=Clostridium sulfidigenes TaxID=318464 RepID=A0A084JBS7_9CLOT|nr:bifunctional oligoribonuclease/PAP phosphatase NrnA [Clostridium sulfidigenes]KEZ86411.1 1-pyrroline-5-carboxylate dehydrogenase [Clostridium sulfidigenes]
MITRNIVDIIEKSNSIGITFHQSPDGDSLGSATALLQGLRALNKEAYILSKEKISDTFEYLPCSEEITGLLQQVKDGTDLIIVLDCGDFKRINANLDAENRQYKLVNIDHHLSNEKYGDFNYVDINSSAVGEIIYDLLNQLKVDITKNIGKSIYTSILTDTSSFKHSNTTSRTHEIAGEIIKTGVNFNKIQRQVFENKEFNKVKFFGKVIDTLTLHLNNKVVFMEINDAMLNEVGLESMDSSEVIHFGTMISGVEVVALFKESKGGIKVSLRSKEIVDVSKVAENFNGGGHKRASGLFCEGSIIEVKDKIYKILEEELISYDRK